jgi:hypothetical protein
MTISVSFSRSGIGNAVLLRSKETFNRVFSIQKALADFDEELGRTIPMKRPRDPFLHLANATRHRALQHFDRFGIARLPHSPYRSDLAPCPYWLFGTPKRKLEESTFRDQIEMRLAVNTIVTMILREEFISMLDEWKSRLREWIKRGRKYLSADSLSSLYFIRSVNCYRANGFNKFPVFA